MADEELKLFEESELERDLKKRVSIWLRASTRQKIEEMYQLDGCKSKSDYVERAVAFYTGYVLSDKADSYLSNMITSSLKSIVRESDNAKLLPVAEYTVEVTDRASADDTYLKMFD